MTAVNHQVLKNQQLSFNNQGQPFCLNIFSKSAFKQLLLKQVVYNSAISNSPKLLDKNVENATLQGFSLKLKKTRHKRVRIFAATLQVEVNHVQMSLVFLSSGFGEFKKGLLAKLDN